MPELFQSLRGAIDRGRALGQRVGRFLILGSAAIDVLSQSSESLAGRIAFLELTPLSVLEVGSARDDRLRLWLRGGFPDSFLSRSDRTSLLLRRDFIRTYLERDVASFGPRVPAETLRRLWTMLAHRQGQLLNASELARSLEVSAQSVGRYIDLLCDLMLVRRLAPFHANLGKRLVKSPKLYIRDSGLTHALLGLERLDQLLGHPVAGASWEGLVVETLISLAPPETTASCYRTAAGVEIDLVLDFVDGTRWAIEAKLGLGAKPRRGFFEACRDLAPTAAFVVHSGEDQSPLSPGVEAIGLRTLAERLVQQA
jgi:hypothetical protein